MVVAKRRGRPPSKNKVDINTDAIVANSELKKANQRILELEEYAVYAEQEIDALQKRIAKSQEDFNGAKLHIETIEKHNSAAMIVIGYLEGKLFQLK
jgi:predicted  nucleic acid-binding Zn-ribbon protein